MKLNRLVLIGVTSAFVSAFSIAASAIAIPPTSQGQVAIANSFTVAQSQLVAIRSGSFVAGEAPTTGTARIVTEGGHRYLELDAAFSTSNQGPDLHVLLEPSATPSQAYENLGGVINLGSLQNYSGAQRYPIPDAINPDNYGSVVIWCRMANATFGYAPLR
jgi:hypothetical protein